MKKKIIVFSLIAIIFFPLVALAQDWTPDPGGDGFSDPDYEKELVKGTSVLERGNLVTIIFNLIKYILAFLGVIAMIVILYAGFNWMTAGGNDEKVGKAKKTLIAGLIGLVIVLLAFAIATFVIQRINIFAEIKK